MRIGFDISKATPPKDGIGHFVHELLRGLVPLFAAGDHELWLYSPLQVVDADQVSRQLGTLPGHVTLRQGPPRAEDGLDLYHSNVWLYPASVGCPVLFTCYDLTFLTHPECHTFENKVHCATGTLQAHLAGAHFLSISQQTADQLHEHLEVSAKRMDVIYPAASEHFRKLDTDAVAKRLNERLGVDGEYFLAVGTIEPRKNLLRLLNAYGDLPNELRQRAPLILAGASGWHDETTLQEVLDRPELSTVRRLGRVSDEDLVDLYNGATVFVYPSLAEGFGLPVVEAMACGTAVLTSAVSATAEIAGDAALLVDPLDTGAITQGMATLLEDIERRRNLEAAGKLRAQDFSWQGAAEATRNLYHRLISAS